LSRENKINTAFQKFIYILFCIQFSYAKDYMVLRNECFAFAEALYSLNHASKGSISFVFENAKTLSVAKRNIDKTVEKT